jgi:glyoxalase family protein
VDEPVNELGKKLMLPSWLESKREELEETLPPIEVRVLEEIKNETYIQ